MPKTPIIMRAHKCIITSFIVLLPYLLIAQAKIIVYSGLSVSQVEMPTSKFGDVPSLQYSQGHFGTLIGVDYRQSQGAMFVQFGLQYSVYTLNQTDITSENYFNAYKGYSKMQVGKAKMEVGIHILPRNKYVNLHVGFGVNPYYILGDTQGSDTPSYTAEDLERLQVNGSVHVGIDLFNRVTLEVRSELSFTDYFLLEDDNVRTHIASIGIMF